MALESLDQSAVASRQDMPVAASRRSSDIAISTTTNFASIEAEWRLLEQAGIQSPGQSYDFLKQWIASFSIAPEDCLFVLVKAGGLPVAALALQRQRMLGARMLTSFTGDHVGSNAPLLNLNYWNGLSAEARAKIWRAVTDHLTGADFVHVCGVPAAVDGQVDLFAGLGQSASGDSLHRAVFENWAQCDATQRSKSRRKHDRQQGAKLDAMGPVDFEVLEGADEIDTVLATMFSQRNQRFKIQGIRDPFDSDDVRAFYRDVFKAGSSLHGRLHVLRLNGDVVATRYNLVHGGRIFCLISSMSVAPEVQPGSPGKQCLLRVMQTEFDNGYAMFDMGQGMTDEKRHWCNVHIPVRQINLSLTLVGRLVVSYLTTTQRLRVAVKSNKRLFAFVKSVRSKLSKG